MMRRIVCKLLFYCTYLQCNLACAACMYLLLSILVPNYLHGLVVVCLAGGEKDGTVGNEGV